MGQRPDDLRRDPLGESRRETDPLADPARGPEEAGTPVGPDPALGGGVGGGAVIDEEAADRVEIERTEIERTRAEMGETVDAIQERISPENLKEEAKDRVKEATVGRAQEAGSGIVETIRANPLPAALTGIGLGWLLVSTIRGGSEQERYGERTYAYDYPATYDYPPHHEERTTNGPSAGEALGRARDKVGENATQAQERAAEVAGRTQDRVGSLADQARYRARRASGGFQRMLQENPLSVGALAVGVGAAVGLAIPESSKEHEVMGETRDNLVEKAQEKAQEAQQKVQRVAEEAQSAAKEEASNQGLTQD
jgi:ElaB/YqjD/DUF883 family membrane-anchored ribosome-binding protein